MSLSNEPPFNPATMDRLSRRPMREFPAGYVYAPTSTRTTTPTHDGEPTRAETREDALAVLSRLAVGVDAERLLERIASREDAEALRSVLLEVGARAVTGRRGSNLQPETAPGGLRVPAAPLTDGVR